MRNILLLAMLILAVFTVAPPTSAHPSIQSASGVSVSSVVGHVECSPTGTFLWLGEDLAPIAWPRYAVTVEASGSAADMTATLLEPGPNAAEITSRLLGAALREVPVLGLTLEANELNHELVEALELYEVEDISELPETVRIEFLGRFMMMAGVELFDIHGAALGMEMGRLATEMRSLPGTLTDTSYTVELLDILPTMVYINHQADANITITLTELPNNDPGRGPVTEETYQYWQVDPCQLVPVSTATLLEEPQPDRYTLAATVRTHFMTCDELFTTISSGEIITPLVYNYSPDAPYFTFRPPQGELLNGTPYYPGGPPLFAVEPDVVEQSCGRTPDDADAEMPGDEMDEDVDAIQMQQLTANEVVDFAPAWSPDGTRIAFVSEIGGDLEIYVMNADGSNLQPLTDNDTRESLPAWSPDGTRIAYTSYSGGMADIWVMNADGSNPRQITETDNHWDEDPAWSPDGTRIVFISNRGGPRDVWIMDADGSNFQQVTSYANPRYPSWSPDGSRIVFVSSYDGDMDVYVVNADGSEIYMPTRNNNYDDYPAWAPDGTHIIFAAARQNEDKIIVINANTGDYEELSTDGVRYLDLAWSPDGTRIAFNAVLDGDSEIYVRMLPDNLRVAGGPTATAAH